MEALIHPTLSKLFTGIKSFQQRAYRLNTDKMERLLEHGQKPKVMVIACSDSRVDPALLMDTEPGDLFVLRHVANLVPLYDMDNNHDSVRSGIEYGVRDLQVEHIIVLGHAHCGGIHTLLSTLSGQMPQRDFIGGWVSIALDACYRYVIGQVDAESEGEPGCTVRQVDMEGLCDHQHLVERAAIRGSLDNLRTYPWIKERLDNGSLCLHGWWFDLESGDLWATSADNSSFLPVLEIAVTVETFGHHA
ncbi:MAG: carbonic anhydrase [Methylovulum sp.]|nr:carbonic anhydrase [Methylovulum sp.]